MVGMAVAACRRCIGGTYKCGVTIARYYCDICKLFDDEPGTTTALRLRLF